MLKAHNGRYFDNIEDISTPNPIGGLNRTMGIELSLPNNSCDSTVFLDKELE
jgi:hypothetical protein